MTQILLVEDDPDIREVVAFSLSRAGFEVNEVESANHALVQAHKQMPDLVVVDWMLPGMSGRQLVEQLRADSVTEGLPVIMLTAKADESAKLEGFKSGVDDYITKPFSVVELTARVKALLRRSGNTANTAEQLKFGVVVLDIKSHRLLIDGQPVVIAPTEFRLLKLMMENPNRAYSRQRLLEKIWGHGTYLEERTVDVHILRLRKVLTPFGCQSWVQTVRGVGYRFSPPETQPA